MYPTSKRLKRALLNWFTFFPSLPHFIYIQQIEQNQKFDFSMTTADGIEFAPVSGAGLVGMKNLGNTCYMASLMQVFCKIPEFVAAFNSDAHFKQCCTLPADCFRCQVYDFCRPFMTKKGHQACHCCCVWRSDYHSAANVERLDWPRSPRIQHHAPARRHGLFSPSHTIHRAKGPAVQREDWDPRAFLQYDGDPDGVPGLPQGPVLENP